jgi:ABC-type lipoprotein export system ATPase subunit
MSKLFETERLGFQYQLGSQTFTALKDVSLAIDEGDFVCLSGPSGSGKTTLLNLLGLIEPVQGGDIRFEGRSYKSLAESERNALRKTRLGFVFQTFQLFPVLTAFENVEFFLARQGLPVNERRKLSENALQAVGLWEHRNKKPLEMSGGQRQRVALARAFAKQPRVILADEPTASLDQATGRQILEIMRELNAKTGVTLIVCSHDPMVLGFGKTQVRLRDGEIQS